MEQVGLGLAIVKQFMDKNYFVCNIDRNIDKMKTLEDTYKENYKGFIGDVSEEKQATFMRPEDVAKTIIDNVTNDTNLTVTDIIIERN